MENEQGAKEPIDVQGRIEAAAAQSMTRQALEELAGKRYRLNADELYRMADARPRFEKEIRRPNNSRHGGKVFFFSIDGILDGAWMKGCLFADSCILTQANTFEEALKLAKSGLESTLELLDAEFEQRAAIEAARAATTAVGVGLTQDVGGKRAREGGGLKSDPKLKAMLAHKIGGLPWKW
jgi:predicted RNase H-like HicB family nuclease